MLELLEATGGPRWSIDDHEELVAMNGSDVIVRIAPGTSARRVRVDYTNALRRRFHSFEMERRSGFDRRIFMRDDGRERRSGTW